MKIALLSCTRDRLPYTQHCFARLRDLAGCEYDHYVLDNGSNDGTDRWLVHEYDTSGDVVVVPTNIGLWRGLNRLVQIARDVDDYDAYVTFDNDCELLTDGVLREVCELAVEHRMALSPKILGLRHPPAGVVLDDGIEVVQPQIGNIFMALPAWAALDRPFNENCPTWGGDEGLLAGYMREHGNGVGYVPWHQANHYRTTDGQHADFPWYFERRVLEGAPRLIVDFDDLYPGNDRLDLLHALHDANPSFRCTVFAVPALGYDAYWERLPEWVEVAMHGWLHGDPPTDGGECRSWPYERMRDTIMDRPSRFVCGFKAPGWKISDGCYRALLEHGWWVADHYENDARRPRGLRTHVLSRTASSGGDLEHWHGHVQNVCGNGIEETFDRLLERVRAAESFEFVSEAVAPW